jgi:multiple sugar transport system ATP-binding protein
LEYDGKRMWIALPEYSHPALPLNRAGVGEERFDVARIEVEGLSRRFGSFAAIEGVNLRVDDGDFLVLLGPSGCGKSTLLRMIAGLIPPSDGRILLDGRDITHAPPRERDLAMVFQSYALYPHLTVERNIGFPLRARRVRRAEAARRVADVAKMLDLSELLHRRPRELSGGQRQRVALGRALVRDPGAFLMDEPLSNLDAKLRTATRAEITDLHRQLGSTFVYVTHDQVEAMTMATRVALLNRGRLEQVGAPTEVYDTPGSVFVAGFLGSPPMNLLDARLARRPGAAHAVADGVDARLELPADVPERPVILGIRPEHLRVVPADVPGAGPAAGDAAGDAAGADAVALRGTVSLVENLGSEEVAHCEVGPARICVRAARPIGLRAGETVALAVRPEHTHLFDPDSGRRLTWRPDSAPAVDTTAKPVPVTAAAPPPVPADPSTPAPRSEPRLSPARSTRSTT